MDHSGKSYVKIQEEFRENRLQTITDCIKHFAELKRDNEAIVFADTFGGRQSCTFGEIYKKSTAVARSLVKLGVKKGELIAINLRNCPEWLYLQFGVMFSGAVPVSISFTYRDGSDLITLMEKLGNCSLLALDPGVDGLNWQIVKTLLNRYSPDGTASSDKLPSLRYVIGHEVGGKNSREMTGVKTISELVDETNSAVTCPIIDKDDAAFLVQTSGSTGVPKLVVHTHRSIMCIRQFELYDSATVQYNDRPFCWMGGYPLSILTGQKRVTVSGFSPIPEDRVTSLIDTVQKEKCTYLVVLPPLLHELIQSKKIPENWPVAFVATGGQPATKSVAGAIGKVAPTLCVGYGGTEFSIVSIANTDNKDNFREYFCGVITKLPGLEVKIVDETGDIVPVNTRGEVYVRSSGMFREYYNDPQKTSAVFTQDGWYKTDDIGMLTQNTEIFIYGRKSSMIISGGMNVNPEILERAMETCAGVANVIIVPVPDQVYYQVLCACVIRQTGCYITEEKLQSYCEEIHNDRPRMFTVLPKYYMFFDEYPETYTGKTSRVELAEIARKTFGEI